MNLQNIKNMRKKNGGFTIVELLIVIVIIGILAALVIIAYTGITQRAKTTKSKTNAAAIQKKAEAYAADTGNGNYPTLTTQFTGDIAGLPTGLTLRTASGAALDGTNGQTVIDYQSCDSGAGYKINYWDFTTSAVSTTPVIGGSQTTCATPAT